MREIKKALRPFLFFIGFRAFYTRIIGVGTVRSIMVGSDAEIFRTILWTGARHMGQAHRL